MDGLSDVPDPYSARYIRSLRVMTDRLGDAVCFVELAVPKNQTRLFSALRGISYGNSFVFKIPG